MPIEQSRLHSVVRAGQSLRGKYFDLTATIAQSLEELRLGQVSPEGFIRQLELLTATPEADTALENTTLELEEYKYRKTRKDNERAREAIRAKRAGGQTHSRRASRTIEPGVTREYTFDQPDLTPGEQLGQMFGSPSVSESKASPEPKPNDPNNILSRDFSTLPDEDLPEYYRALGIKDSSEEKIVAKDYGDGRKLI